MGKTSSSKTFMDCLCLCLSCGGGGAEEATAEAGDTKSGHPPYGPGDVLQERYQVVDTLGEGTFGQVLRCWDSARGGRGVALKILKKVDKYGEDDARLEILVLEKLSRKDPASKIPCVQMLDWFYHRGHVCISFQLLALSTFHFQKENNFLPYCLQHLRHMAQQICHAVSFLHHNKLTHTDLKPENILFVHGDYFLTYNTHKKCSEKRLRDTSVRVVDFGSATFEHEHHSTVVSTRHYRAPEVILELGWSHPCDVWSIGCILFEYYQGSTLYQTHDNEEHLAMMEHIHGPIPQRMIQTSRKQVYFQHGRLKQKDISKSGRHVSAKCRPLRECIQSQSEEHQQFLDLLEKMLEYEPSQRISLSRALRHPFLAPPGSAVGSQSPDFR
ncbi:dual specificity protein kinase CLK2b isoform X2 [Nerophis ophidion]|uniref:dual specificity protein kinase CLK2b isoform X2 n=1 Tax=Nerophis ophidion TaxID=159077 RepID=UPI002AE0967A|nr:dual specificity protein kinase CLK2b isoform X2 [Nerophis ophidion]